LGDGYVHRRTKLVRITRRGRARTTRINVQDTYEIERWTRTFSCTEEELRVAVAEVGDVATLVEAYLKNKKIH
jgi:membrane-bound inhibitor of C-type lysozyme